MGSTILIKRGTRSSTSELLYGELAYDSNNKILYIGDNIYTLYTDVRTGSPKALNLYVVDDEDLGTYMRTDDTTFVDDKNYYTHSSVADISISGNAATSTLTDGAETMVNSSGSVLTIGSATQPVYFNNGVPTVVSAIQVASGGTGATTASDALSNLGALPLSGGTLTGTLTVDDIDMNKTNIENANALIFKDVIDSAGEGIFFPRSSSGNYDAVYSQNGTLYYSPNITLSSEQSNKNTIYHSGLTVPIANGGTGGTTVSTARTNLLLKVGTTAPASAGLSNGDIYFYYLTT